MHPLLRNPGTALPPPIPPPPPPTPPPIILPCSVGSPRHTDREIRELYCFYTETLLTENASKNQNGGMTKICKSQLVKVSLMSPSQREVFEQTLKSAEEVACTLAYEEGWSLLRPKKQQVCYVVVITVN